MLLPRLSCLPATLRNFTALSKPLVSRPGNVSQLRCYTARSSQFNNLTAGPIAFRNSLCPNSLQQLTKITGNNIIPKRWSTHDHVNLWKIERIVATVFVPLFPLCFLLDNVILDSLLAVLTVAHIHWGFEAIIVDYARPIVIGPMVPKVCFALLYAMSALTLAGLLILAVNGPGISRVIKQGWAIGHEEPVTDKKDKKKKDKKDKK